MISQHRRVVVIRFTSKFFFFYRMPVPLGKMVIRWVKKNNFGAAIKTLRTNLLTTLSSGFKTSSIAAFFFLLIGVIQPVFGQITFDSKEELVEAANTFFNEQEYSKAKPLFSQLLSQDALNADYNYRFGVCILFTEDDPIKPMPYIEGGAGSPGVNSEAFYFLGKLYQLNYRFDEAIDAFSKAKSKGVSLQNVDIDLEIQACRSGNLLYNPDYDFNPVSAKTAIEKEFYRPYDFRKLKGKVIPMPPQFKTKFDQKNLGGSFVFTPMVGQTLFYASYGEDGSNGKDIYRVKKLPNGEWALPVRLPEVINSKLDEDHAFYDTQNDVLYFSSQGHNSMGGSDIFQSAYNPKDDSWSSPMNLQYPFSSPYDDYLYVSDPGLSVAFFTSTRESEEGHVKVFRVALPNKEGDPVSIITGQYIEAEDSTQTTMKAQLRSNNELIGEYKTNSATGKYVIVAKPGQGYELSVAPRNEEAFQFPIDLPKHFKFKPLEQDAIFSSSNDAYSVELTNYFNNKGEKDSITVVKSKSSGELPGVVASVENSKTESVQGTLADAAEKGKAEARNEIAIIERQVREKESQDSIAQILAEVESNKAAELALQKEQSRLDSLATAEHLAAEAELEKQRLEAGRLAQEQAEQARLDSIAKAEA
ncbi:MAG: tetratricopeptide (TPR) repeat protein, partial [Granulosicoccus sp.]